MSANEPASPTEIPPGNRLRQARESAGLTLAQVAQRTLIPVSRLQSLEKDDYGRVGVATFVVGYTRTYARVLGLDPAPLVQQLEARLPSEFPTRHQAPSVALSLEVRKRPGTLFGPLMWLFLGVLVVVAVIGLSSLGEQNSRAPTQDTPGAPVPGAPTPGAPTPGAPISATSESALPQPEATIPTPAALMEAAPAADEPATEVVPATETPPSPEAAPAADAAPEPLPQPAGDSAVAAPANPVSATRSELVMSFSGECWVEVVDASGKRIVARLASSGDNLRLFGPAPFNVILGDARVVEMTVNGRPVETSPPAGRKMLRLAVAE